MHDRGIDAGSTPVKLYTDLLLLNPAPNVVFGMPIFASTDSGLLRAILRNHGEWWDNASQWFVSHSQEPPGFGLRVEFGHRANGKRYLKTLEPHLPDEWTLRYPLKSRKDDFHIERSSGTLSLSHAWMSSNDALPLRVDASAPDVLAKQSNFWFCCDGAIALDLSALPMQVSRTLEIAVADMIGQSDIFARLNARAECCFLFHVLSLPANDTQADQRFSVIPVRRGTLPGRAGLLFEANLRSTSGAAPNADQP